MINPAYIRARTNLIKTMLKETTDPLYTRLLQKGFFHPDLLKGYPEKNLIESYENQYPQDNKKPLSFTEIAQYSNYFALHPEKLAGTYKVETSIQFPLSIKGTKQDIIDVIEKTLKPQTPNNEHQTINTEQYLELELELEAEAIAIELELL